MGDGSSAKARLIEHLARKMDDPLGEISKLNRSETEGDSSWSETFIRAEMQKTEPLLESGQIFYSSTGKRRRLHMPTIAQHVPVFS